MDPSEIERLREKAREEVPALHSFEASLSVQHASCKAVVGVGKAYSKRPTTVEGEMWRGTGPDAQPPSHW